MRNRFFLILMAALLIGACSASLTTSNQPKPASPTPASAPSPQQASTDAVREFLLASAAKDFHDHKPPEPARFRDVRIGHITADGKESYRLCGEFQEEGKSEWMGFVTIKTSGYEQYIGSQVATYCPATMIWDSKEDLSSELQSRVNAAR